MPRGRRRKIELPSGDTQPQFELGDTAEDIERRREREEKEERDPDSKTLWSHHWPTGGIAVGPTLAVGGGQPLV